MESILGVAILWLAFAGTHIGLGTRRIRAELVARLGEWGFLGLFSLVASVTFAALVRYYAVHRLEGPGGLALGESPWLRALLIAAVFLGLVLAFAGFHSYPASPYALGNPSTRAPRGLERITRHPFFVGVGIMGTAHALLASRLVGTLFFGALAVYAFVGAWQQDKKLLALRGRPYGEYLAATSAVPFAAVLAGRQRIVWAELSWVAIAGSALVVLLLRVVHGSILAHGGAWVIGSIVGGAAALTLKSWRNASRRAAVRPETAPAS